MCFRLLLPDYINFCITQTLPNEAELSKKQHRCFKSNGSGSGQGEKTQIKYLNQFIAFFSQFDLIIHPDRFEIRQSDNTLGREEIVSWSKYYFFHNFLQNSLQKSFQLIFYRFTKMKIKSYEFPKFKPATHLFYFQSIKIVHGPSDSWSMRRSHIILY